MAWKLRAAVVIFPTTQWRPRAASTRPLAGSHTPAGPRVYAALPASCNPPIRSLAGGGAVAARGTCCVSSDCKRKKKSSQTINFFLSMQCREWGETGAKWGVLAFRLPASRSPPSQTSLCIDQHVTSVLISLQKAKVKCNRAAHRPRTWGGDAASAPRAREPAAGRAAAAPSPLEEAASPPPSPPAPSSAASPGRAPSSPPGALRPRPPGVGGAHDSRARRRRRRGGAEGQRVEGGRGTPKGPRAAALRARAAGGGPGAGGSPARILSAAIEKSQTLVCVRLE